jgi:uncharacterized protein YfcZ (UPF0381/DUF406 family)
VETVASRLQETGQQFSKQSEAFVARTRDAGLTFIGETRQAGVQLVGAVKSEAKRWRRFATQRASAIQSAARVTLSVAAVEKAVLVQVDETLRLIDARVRARLAQLERKPAASRPARKAAASGNKAATRSRKAKPALPAIAA